jgi:hypothetical protein
MLLFVPRLSAIGDLRQKLADALDVGFCPPTDIPVSYSHRFGGRQFSLLNVTVEVGNADTQLLGCLIRRKKHPDNISQIGAHLSTEI